MDSTYFDIFVATILITFAMKGASSGLLNESKELISVILAIMFFADASVYAKDYITTNFNFTQSTVLYLSYIISFVSVYLVFLILLHIYSLFMGNFGLYDKMAGLFFSVFKIIFIISILLYSFITYVDVSQSTSKFLKGAKTYPYLYKVGEYVFDEFDKRSDVNVDDVVEGVVKGVVKLSNIDKDRENEDDLLEENTKGLGIKDLGIDKILLKEIQKEIIKRDGE
jgi:uncharacterized membrane protein required for colicin V production